MQYLNSVDISMTYI